MNLTPSQIEMITQSSDFKWRYTEEFIGMDKGTLYCNTDNGTVWKKISRAGAKANRWEKL